MSFRIPSRVAHWVGGEDLDTVVFLRSVPGGQNYVLSGSGALIWCVAAEGAEDVPAELAEMFSVPVEEIRRDVLDHLDELVSKGLLEPHRDTGKH
ncbi:MAG TPA: PqqD family protein [Intrasporangiaceae bacterium]|nr:PqqD family protein [Intrasporangiaceae bacterium]